MNHLQIRDLLPRPIRELVFGIHDIRLLIKSLGKNQTVESFIASKPGEKAVEEMRLMICSALQVALFVSGFWAVKFFECNMRITGIFVTILSPASMMIGTSFFGFSYGTRILLSSIGTGSFLQFIAGMTVVAASYSMLEHLEVFQIGFLGRFAKQAAELGAPRVVKNML